MKILVSLVLLFSGALEAACGFRSQQRVFSLSGPMTSLLEEMGLLSSPQLAGLTVFYPDVTGFRGKRISGGVFLSPSQLKDMKGSLIFYDESQELQKLFRYQGIEAVEVKTRGLTPREAFVKTISLLEPFTSKCDFQKTLSRLSLLEQEITSRMKKKESIIFFLGEVHSGKLPELVIAHDGLVLWLKTNFLIETYPSELAYVNWSGPVIHQMKEKSLFLGMKEGKNLIKGDKKRATLVYPGVLIPGILQLKAWKYFLDHRPR